MLYCIVGVVLEKKKLFFFACTQFDCLTWGKANKSQLEDSVMRSSVHLNPCYSQIRMDN